MSSVEQFRQDFANAQKNPPAVGDILRPYDEGGVAKLRVDLEEGKAPFIYGQAYVPCIVGTPVKGWCLQSPDCRGVRGMRCIIMSRARDNLIRKFPELPEEIHVKSLRVVRYNSRNTAMLCEVHEYCD